ncbi:phage tail protein [Empedobacter sp.]|uniref:phage tail protein n=1 Tax=Empedobacter sp. TaxID=1927715 RepID=UPI00289D5B19|nr:phage tail protein [Empedobacter sp.]
MYYNIKRHNVIIATVAPTGTYTAKIMGDELVNMSFTLADSVEFLIGDMVEVFGQLFILNVAPTEEKISSIQFNYTLQFESIKYELGKIQLLFPDSSNALTISDFSIMGDAHRVLELIIENANRVQSGWKLGTIDETETKNFSFSAHNLLTALTMLADEFKNEFWIDQDKTIHFTTRKEFSGLKLEYGVLKGLRGLLRTVVDSSNIVTRLYAYGGDKNISSDYRNYSKRLKMDVPYLEANVEKFGIIEHTEMFDDIFPNRIGKVTAINSNNFLQFSDSTLDFNVNETLVPNTSVKVTFNTGQLAGYTFEVKEFGFNNSTKTFELQPSEQEKAITVPSELMRPAVGDEYVLTDIIMPDQYKTEAESELKQRATEYLIANCLPRLQYSVLSDPFSFELLNIVIELGKTVEMFDTDFNLDARIRVIGLTKDLQDVYDVSFDLADEVQVSRIVREYLDDQRWANQVITHQQKVDRNIRRNYQFTREIQDNIFDTDGYFDSDKIKPLSIETKMLSVAARSQQFQVQDVQMNIVDNSTVRNTSGQMVHFTIADSERVWNILAAQINNISAVFNYIYLRCQRDGNQASFLITTEQIKFDADPNFYHFEYGYLSSIMEGFRKIKTSYGFSAINGGEITSGKILGQNGDLFIDIDNRKVVGKIEFTSDSPAFNQVKDSIQISNRNLLLNSGIEYDYTNGTQAYHLLSYITKDRKLLKGEEYTVLIDITTFENRTAQLWFINNNNVGNSGLNYIENFNTENESKRKIRSFPFRAIEEDSLNFGINVYNYGYQSGENEKMNNRFILHKIALYKGNKAIDWTPAPEDIEVSILQSKTDSINASKAYSDAQDELKRIQTQAYADGKVTAAERRAIDDATAKAEAAKVYAAAQDNLLRVQLEAYADGQITAEEQERIQQMQDNLAAAKAYAEAQTNLAKIAAAAYADGIVDEEEARAIADATAKMEAAKQHAQNLVNNIQISNRNLLLNSGIEYDYTNGTQAYHLLSYITKDRKLLKGEEYTVLIDITTFENRTAQLWFINNNNVGNSGLNYIENFNTENESKRKIRSFPFRAIEEDSLNFGINVYNYGYQSGENEKMNNRFILHKIALYKGNKAIDWTPAPEDVEASILQAKQLAEQANLKVANISNDNVLSASEKQQISNEWNRIKSEYTSNYSLAINNGISTTDYTNYYNDLYNYITPLLVNISVDSAIVGDVFRTKFKAYYDQNIALIVAINDKLRSGINTNTGAINQLNSTLERINKVTSFLGTTVDNNVIATGVVLVGQGANGTGGLSGIRDNNDDSIFLFAGADFNNRYRARWIMSHGGFERGYHSNGILGFERGYDGSKWIFNMYNESGAPLFQLDSVRGLVPVNYTSESWSRVTLLKTNIVTRDYNTVQSSLKSFIESNVSVSSVRHNPDEYFNYMYWVYSYSYNNIYVCWDYYNGTHPNNAQYANYVGYKVTSDSRTNNITDGWYFRAMDGVFSIRDGTTGNQTFELYATVYYIQNGKIIETQNLNYIK